MTRPNLSIFFDRNRNDFFYQLYPFRRSGEKYVRLAADLSLPISLFIRNQLTINKIYLN